MPDQNAHRDTVPAGKKKNNQQLTQTGPEKTAFINFLWLN